MIKRLFEAMRTQLEVMAEHGDNEAELLQELEEAPPEILDEYANIYLTEGDNMKKYYIAICEKMGSVWNLGTFETLREARKAILHEMKYLTKAERKKQALYIGTVTANEEEIDPDYFGDFEEIF